MDSDSLRVDRYSIDQSAFESTGSTEKSTIEKFHQAHGLLGESVEDFGARIERGQEKLAEWQSGGSVDSSFEGLSDVEKERLAADVLTAVSFQAISSSGEIKEGAMLDSHAFTIRDDQEILANVMDQVPTYNRASTHYKPFIYSNMERAISKYKELKEKIDETKAKLKNAKKVGDKGIERTLGNNLKDLKAELIEIKREKKDASYAKGCDFTNSKLFSTRSHTGSIKPRTHCVFYSYVDKSGKKYFAMKLEEAGWKGTNMRSVDDLKVNLHHVRNFITSRDFVSKWLEGKKGAKLDRKVTVTKRRDTDKRLQKATMKALSDSGIAKIKKRGFLGKFLAMVTKLATRKPLDTKSLVSGI